MLLVSEDYKMYEEAVKLSSCQIDRGMIFKHRAIAFKIYSCLVSLWVKKTGFLQDVSTSQVTEALSCKKWNAAWHLAAEEKISCLNCLLFKWNVMTPICQWRDLSSCITVLLPTYSKLTCLPSWGWKTFKHVTFLTIWLFCALVLTFL